MLNLIGNVYNLTGMQIAMWNKIKKFLFEPSEKDKERVERWKKLTIEDFDKDDEMEEVQVTKHMSVKEKKKTKPVNYNF